MEGICTTQRIWSHLRKIKVKRKELGTQHTPMLAITIVEQQASISRLGRRETDMPQ